MNWKKIRTTSLLALCLFWAVLFQTSCSSDVFDIDGYEVIGSSTIQNTIPYDFTSTLITLYPDTDGIVLAEIFNTTENSCEFVVRDTLVGPLKKEKTYQGKFYQSPPPSSQGLYLLFLEHNSENVYQILLDGAGWLRINGNEIFPSDNYGTANLKQAIRTVDRLDQDILLPSRFYYYRELEELALESDSILIGTLINAKPTVENYFTRYNGVETNFVNSDSVLYTFSVDKVLKGTPPETIEILLAETMLQNTSRASNDKLVTYTLLDAPYVEEKTPYLIFLKNASKLEAFDAFFINPIQGYIPILKDGDEVHTMSVPTNAAFVEEENIDDVIGDIELYLSGENISTQYEPFSLN